MDVTACLKEIGRGRTGARDLSREAARELFAAILDGEVPDLELGALLAALRIKEEGPEELLGFHDVLTARLPTLRRPSSGTVPVVISTYSGARRNANLTPLLALLLQRLNIPVLLHGVSETFGRTGTFALFDALGIPPAADQAGLSDALDTTGLVWITLDVLCPPLARLIGLRRRLGLRNSAHTLVKLMDPFAGNGVRMISVSHPGALEKLRVFLAVAGGDALLMRGTEGEPYANPKRCPQIEHFAGGQARIMVEAETGTLTAIPELAGKEIDSSLIWIREVLAGERPLPRPLACQLAACLVACGIRDDFDAAMEHVRAASGCRID